jgi:hypothetical protein
MPPYNGVLDPAAPVPCRRCRNAKKSYVPLDNTNVRAVATQLMVAREALFDDIN